MTREYSSSGDREDKSFPSSTFSVNPSIKDQKAFPDSSPRNSLDSKAIGVSFQLDSRETVINFRWPLRVFLQFPTQVMDKKQNNRVKRRKRRPAEEAVHDDVFRRRL